MSNGTPLPPEPAAHDPIHDLIAEAHAAREAGDHAQMDAALGEMRRLTAEANASEETAVQEADDPVFSGNRFASGLLGAAEGVKDSVLGTASTAKRALTEWRPDQMRAQGEEIVKGVRDLPANLRDVTQKFRAGEIGPEELARAWTGAAATVLSPMLGPARGGGPEAPIWSRGLSMTKPLRLLGRKGIEGAKAVERVVAPRRALNRIWLKEAEGKAAGQPSPSEAQATPDQLVAAKRLGVPVEQLFSNLGSDTKIVPRGNRGGGVGRLLSPEQIKEYDTRFAARRRPSAEPDALRTALVEQIGGGGEPTVTPPSDPGGRAAQEMMARKQPGATKGQLAWRAERFGLSPDLKSTAYRDLTEQLKDPEVSLAMRQAIRAELRRRGIAGYSE